MPQPEELDPTPGSDPPGLERRAFVRRMTNDAVGAAGRVFGLSKALTRGAVAAGQAVRDNFEAATVEQGAGTAAADAPEAAEALSAGEEEPTAAPVPATEPPRSAPPAPFWISDAQAAILAAATTAVLAVNGRDSAPLATPVRIHWDGETVRFGSLGWSRRTTAIRMDPRVTLYVEDPESDGFLAIEGLAAFIIGADARDAMAPLLSSTGDPAEVELNWAALMAADADRVVVVVRPSKALPGRRS